MITPSIRSGELINGSSFPVQTWLKASSSSAYSKLLIKVSSINQANGNKLPLDSPNINGKTSEHANSHTYAPPEDGSIEKTPIKTNQVNGSSDENDKNQANQHASLDKRPSKPPRKPCLNESNGYEQQTDNLVEEIYLAAEPGPEINDNSIEVDKKCNNLSVNGLSSSKHFVVVAIDFGTTYSGYALSFTRSPESIHMMRKWDDGCDPDVNNHKTPTILLLKPTGEFYAFGTAAREAYHALSPEEAKEWFYFEKFKMSLHTTVNLTKSTELVAANGKKMAALTVFGHSLRYFKNHALAELSEQCATKIEDDDVRWVLTVPAIWRQTAKQFMRMAAYQAGLASSDNPSQLLISPEPEAAAIYCRKLKINQLIPEAPNKNDSIRSTNGNLFNTHDKDVPSPNSSDQAISIKKGTRYMVVDCGGGTVDITVHEIHDDLKALKELHRASGCPFGSTGIDKEFENLLEDIFGAKFMDDFRTKLPSGYVTLMTTFEGRKRAANTLSTTPFNIALPFSFIQSVRKWKGSGVDSIVKKYASPDISFDPRLGILRLSAGLMRKLFEPTCEKIVAHINSILESKNCCSESSLGYLFLVGGFAESQLLQSYVRSAFSSRLRVIIPQSVSSSILRGAVLFGLDPSVISVRRSKLTYGIGILNRFIHGYHPLSKLVTRDGIEWCSDIFDKFVLTDQSIASGDVVTRSYTPAKSGQKFTVLNIYCSERDDVRFITDEGVQRCGTLVLDLDDLDCENEAGNDGKLINNSTKKIENNDKQQKEDKKSELREENGDASSPSTKQPPVPPSLPPQPEIRSKGREIQTHMIFGDTEIKVTAVDVLSGRKVRAEIDFLSQ